MDSPIYCQCAPHNTGALPFQFFVHDLSVKQISCIHKQPLQTPPPPNVTSIYQPLDQGLIFAKLVVTAEKYDELQKLVANFCWCGWTPIWLSTSCGRCNDAVERLMGEYFILYSSCMLGPLHYSAGTTTELHSGLHKISGIQIY